MKRITLYVGTGFDKNGKEIDAVRLTYGLSKIRQRILEDFGGFSEGPVTGAWQNAKGEIVTEPSMRFEIIATHDADVQQLALDIRNTLNQESVLVTQETITADFI